MFNPNRRSNYERGEVSREEKRGVGRKILGIFRRGDLENRREKEWRGEALVMDVGVYDLEKNFVATGESSGRASEDASFYDSRRGIFAVFDGAGGVGERGSGRIASQAALEAFKEEVSEQTPEKGGELAGILDRISNKVAQKTEGITTVTVCKLNEDENGRYLEFAQAGDSRLYLIRGGKAEQLTRDEGEGRAISNWLGRRYGDEAPRDGHYSSMNVQQVNRQRIQLFPGDRIVLCSDGVTGDTPEEQVSNETLGRVVSQADSPQAAANILCRSVARKVDDRTAIVFDAYPKER